LQLDLGEKLGEFAKARRSQLAPSARVVVTLSSPCGFSRLSIRRLRTASSFIETS